MKRKQTNLPYTHLAPRWWYFLLVIATHTEFIISPRIMNFLQQ